LINQSNSSNIYRNSNRILLVDDEPDITFSFNMILEDNGFAVDSYNDPIHALSSFKSGIYAIAILDIRMPGMNGFEFVRKVREISPTIKILLMSAFEINSTELSVGLGETKIEGFIQKPISLREMTSIVQKQLEIKMMS
jgi:two-component system, OmpR family, response regulator ChvI